MAEAEAEITEMKSLEDLPDTQKENLSQDQAEVANTEAVLDQIEEA